MLVGAAVAGAIKQPELALPAAFFSHYFLDLIPHWDGGGPKPPYKAKIVLKVGGDYFLGLALVYLLTVNNPRQLLLLAAAVMATMPDIIEGLLTMVNGSHLTLYQKIHHKIQGRLPFTLGMATNIIIGLLGALLLPLR